MTILETSNSSSATQSNALYKAPFPCATGGHLSRKVIPPSVPSPPPPRRNDHRTPESSHQNTMIQNSSRWIFTEEEVLSSPSIRDGLDPVEERCRRAKGVNFITQAGILLKLPQLTIATASIFFHRYFMRQTMLPEKGGVHHYLTFERNIAATSLFLATKTEENCRKTREIVVAVAKVAQKNPSLIIDEQSKEYWKWRDSILLLEEHMLELLTFDLVVHTPHTSLLRYLETLGIEENKSLRNSAWAFLNDSCMSPLCLTMPAPDITIAAIYFAVKLNNETLPDFDNVPWWQYINGNPEKIVKAVTIVDRFWTENPLKKNDRPFGSSPSSQADLDRTRRRGSDVPSSIGYDYSETGGESRRSQNLPNSQHTLDGQGSFKSDLTPTSIINGNSREKLTNGNCNDSKSENNEIHSLQKSEQNKNNMELPTETDQDQLDDNIEMNKSTSSRLGNNPNDDSSIAERDSRPSPPKRRLNEQTPEESQVKRLKLNDVTMEDEKMQ
ncbi:Bgt-3491 [Blumeria graminis f. sp. tritici]|uniref:RNA polymerase II holoenzyme cyclin-like subunit n=2 Tax=Blumeria graminis f. sp. tritici TaxID=62690 RepID=A0A381LIP4_BLUGR|nr:hypothetical protein BGT96224_3491 [Blumeria graminis f. sp. tritici 96224]VDB89512.1 Bgt-3491 [Blumeria graminis f. sp. tritici]